MEKGTKVGPEGDAPTSSLCMECHVLGAASVILKVPNMTDEEVWKEFTAGNIWFNWDSREVTQHQPGKGWQTIGAMVVDTHFDLDYFESPHGAYLHDA